MHWISYHLTKSCFQSVVSAVVIVGGGDCRSWIEGVALIEPRWHLHTPQCRLQSGTNSSTPPLQLHQSVVGIDPGGRGCSRSKCICEEDLGRMDEEKRKWGRGGRSRNQQKGDWWRSWRSPPAMTFSDSTPSRCYSHLTIIRGRIWSPAIKVVLALQNFWRSKFTNLNHAHLVIFYSFVNRQNKVLVHQASSLKILTLFCKIFLLSFVIQTFRDIDKTITSFLPFDNLVTEIDYTTRVWKCRLTSRISMMAIMTNMSIRFWAMAMQRLNPHYYAGLHPPPLPRSSSVPSSSSTSLSIIASLISSSYPNKCRTTKSPTSSFSGRGSWCCPHPHHLWQAFQGE